MNLYCSVSSLEMSCNAFFDLIFMLVVKTKNMARVDVTVFRLNFSHNRNFEIFFCEGKVRRIMHFSFCHLHFTSFTLLYFTLV